MSGMGITISIMNNLIKDTTIPKTYRKTFESYLRWLNKKCSHEWHADQDNDCNFCVKCGAIQEIYTEK